jgi:glycosyltransferase involved in cell wall biosynthesis
VSEVVRDGENGFLLAPDDVAGVAERVAEILADDVLRSRLSAGASAGLEEFGREAMVRHQEELYRELACQAGLR